MDMSKFLNHFLTLTGIDAELIIPALIQVGYLISVYLCVSYQLSDWSHSDRIVVTSRMGSLTHALITCLAGLHWLLQTDWSFRYSDPITPWESLVIKCSMAYFTVDLFYVLICEPSLIFILHHLASIITWRHLLHIGRYGPLAMFGFFLGEVSNPFYILWFLAKKYRTDELSKVLFMIYMSIFIPLRLVLIPLLSFTAFREIWSYETGWQTPLILTGSLGFLMFGGIWWSIGLLRNCYRRSKSASATQST